MAKKNDWVRIHRVVLPAEGRNPNLPEDTAKVPLEMWTKGFLQADAEIGDEVEVITATGRKLARIPVEPRLARMLLAASQFATLPSALPIVAAMSCDDPRRRPVDEKEKADQAHAQFRVPGSDFLGTLKLWKWWDEKSKELSQTQLRKLAPKTYLSYPKMREWRDLVRQLTDLSKRLGLDIESDNGCGDSYTATFTNKEDAIAWLSTRIKEKVSVSITDYTDNNKTISVVGVDFTTYKTIMERLNSQLRKH